MLFPRLTVSETQHNKIDISNLGEASTLHEQQDVDNEPPEKRFCLDSTLQGQSIPEMQQLLDASNVKVLTLKKKLKTLQQRTRRLKKKVTSLQQIVTKLRQNNLISSNCEEMLSQTFSGVPLAVMKKMSTKISGKGSKYSSQLKFFALTLQFYSAKAYEFVRKTFSP